MESLETTTRKREREDETHDEDPLFVNKKRRVKQQRGAKKVNAIVKQVIKKSDVDDAKVGENREPKDPEGKARGYQMEILREAQRRNVIIYLETGCGKTLIAVLLMRSLAHKLRLPNEKRIAVFLVPTVNLVHQQSSVVDCHTDLKVGEYVGHMGVDAWKAEKWHQEIAEHEVLVMTPQIFLDLLTHAVIKLDIVELLVFDECHHATKKHPYCKIMDRYREMPVGTRPKIFGMTASPVNRRGVSSVADADKQLAALEQQLDAKVVAVKDRSELELFVPTPRTFGLDYDPHTFPMEDHKLKLQAIAEKHQSYEAEDTQFKDYDELRKKLHKGINKLCNALVYCLADLGILCARKAAEILLKEDVKETTLEPNLDTVIALKAAKDSFLKDALEFLRCAIPEDAPEKVCEQVKAGLISPKVKCLVDMLMTYRDVTEVRCIVFVDRVIAAVVLASVIDDLDCLSFLRCKHLAGMSSPLDNVSRKFQQTAIESFRAGQVNLLVATNVAEEGLDVQSCHSVIRFDLCRTVRSYIQSRGRARRPGSDYIVFMEKGNEREKEDFDKIVQSEIKMTEKALDRPAEDVATPLAPPPVTEIETYRVESTGAIITTEFSVSFMYRFCAKLPGDKYYTPRPEFTFVEEAEAIHVCILKLPPNAPIHELTGSARRNPLLAKQVVCLEACKILHSLRAIDEHLLPTIEDAKVDEAEIMNLKDTKNRGAGTTKQKELHNKVSTCSLKGTWGKESNAGASLYAYELKFVLEFEDTNSFSGFTFLVETKLDDDVARLKVELVLRLGRIVTAEFCPVGEVHLSAEQVRDAKEYQQLLFNGMFSKLLTRSSKVPGALSTHKALVVGSNGEVWDSRKMYLLLPRSVERQIDWKSVTDTAQASRRFRSLYTAREDVKGALDVCETEDVKGSLDVCEPRDVKCSLDACETEKVESSVDSCETEKVKGSLDACENENVEGSLEVCENEDVKRPLTMAFGAQCDLSDVVDTVILTIHTGMIYVITKITDKTPKAAFPDTHEGQGKGQEGSKFSSYCDYFAQKHKRPLKYPDQPMLHAKQTHRCRNLLARNSVCGKKKKVKANNAQEGEVSHIEIPPELCVVLGISTSVVRSAYLVPSVMHRLEAALTASDLRRVITRDRPECPDIPVLRIVEALTTLRCLEEFSLEGLELLGDSFLKYAQSRYLFLEFENKHEGQLSARRCREICNAKLHSLAMSHRLPEFIRDEVFDPSYWVPPGMNCPKTMLCRCNLSNLCQFQMEGRANEGDDVPQKISSKVVKIGKSCANGHRWLCSKTISDVVEALIGAYLVEGGEAGALSFMTWAGYQVQVEQQKIERARSHSAVDPTINVGADLQGLEAILNYSFTNKALLVEAITHASHLEVKGGFCYQRLEFLGDAVLDLLITKHLFFLHPGLTPGRLTDLRSAAVNNECFARVAVKHKFNKYLRHGSGFLLKQVEEFVKTYKNSSDHQKDAHYGWDGVKGPKVLGDLVESITGAVLVDSGFDLETVWQVMQPILAPIVTPETLPLHPVRELQELCHLRDFGMVLQVIQDEEVAGVIINVNIGGSEAELSTRSSQTPKKTAQKDAAQQMLVLLERRGIWHPCKVSTLGESCRRATLEIRADSDGESTLNKRKFNELANSRPDSAEEASTTDKKLRPSLQEAISLFTNVGSSVLCTNELKRELDSEAHPVVVVPA